MPQCQQGDSSWSTFVAWTPRSGVRSSSRSSTSSSELGAKDQLLVVTDYEPSGIGYQIDLRRETRGKFEFSYDQRSDGAWVAFIRPRKP